MKIALEVGRWTVLGVHVLARDPFGLLSVHVLERDDADEVEDDEPEGYVVTATQDFPFGFGLDPLAELQADVDREPAPLDEGIPDEW